MRSVFEAHEWQSADAVAGLSQRRAKHLQEAAWKLPSFKLLDRLCLEGSCIEWLKNGKPDANGDASAGSMADRKR